MMRLALRTLLAGAPLIALALPAYATVPVVFGTSWDPPGNALQDIVDARYGPGMIDVLTDYIGASPSDPDPFYWTGLGFTSYLVEEVAGYRNRNLLGWYIETGSMPVIDGTDDGIVFTGMHGPGFTTSIALPTGVHPFGLYMNPNGPNGAQNAPEPELFFTNRLFNDRGPDGSGAVHPPTDGDVQAVVYDVSALTQPFTWLVCFEDLDSGPNPGACCTGTDNDFNDMVFEVTVAGQVPVQQATFGQIKALFR
jgi:hypothetical protein